MAGDDILGQFMENLILFSGGQKLPSLLTVVFGMGAEKLKNCLKGMKNSGKQKYLGISNGIRL